MVDILLTRHHHAPVDRLREAVQQLAQDSDLYGLFHEWKGPQRLLLLGKGITAVITFDAESIHAEITLPWLFRMVRGVIAGEVEDRLRQVVTAAEAADAAPPTSG